MKKYLSFFGAIMLSSSACLTSVISFTSHSTLQNNSNIQRELTLKENVNEDFVLDSIEQANNNFNWSVVRKYLTIDASDLNDTSIWNENYKPKDKWKVWDWGVKIHFEEGVVNVMRLYKIYLDLYGYDENNWTKPFEKLTNEFYNFFIYVDTIERENKYNPITVLEEKLEKLNKALKETKLPVNKFVYNFLNTFTVGIKRAWDRYSRRTPTVEDAAYEIEEEFKKFFGEQILLDEIVPEILEDCENLKTMFKEAFIVTNRVKKAIPLEVFKNITFTYVVNQIIKNDHNRKGVYFKLQNYTVPLGFYAK